jgi:hypothetical protein
VFLESTCNIVGHPCVVSPILCFNDVDEIQMTNSLYAHSFHNIGLCSTPTMRKVNKPSNACPK